MIDYKRDSIESAAQWTSLEKDVSAVHAESIKFLSSGVLEFGKITVQSLIYINAGALTIAPAIVKIVSEGQQTNFKYFFYAIGAFVVGLILGLVCSYTTYIQYNCDLAEQIGIKERSVEFFKTTKSIAENVNFVRFDSKRYDELVAHSDKYRKYSSRINYVVRASGWLSAISFIAGSVFAASHVLKIDIFRVVGL